MTGLTGAKVYTVFLSMAFLPMSLLFGTLPQHLENMELARRFKIKYQTIAASALAAFVTALAVGMFTFLVFSYYGGETFNGASIFPNYVPGNTTASSIAAYPLWISHFRGEEGLDKYTDIHWVRIWFMIIGFGVFGLLTFLRGRFLRFPLNPIGYILLLFSLWYEFVSPYVRGGSEDIGKETSFLWGSAFLAWLVKKMIIKYGGMNTYKQAKPFFVGLVAGSVFCIFAWNATHLMCSAIAGQSPDASAFVKVFANKPPYSPKFY
jgi:hypothetical protein